MPSLARTRSCLNTLATCILLAVVSSVGVAWLLSWRADGSGPETYGTGPRREWNQWTPATSVDRSPRRQWTGVEYLPMTLYFKGWRPDDYFDPSDDPPSAPYWLNPLQPGVDAYSMSDQAVGDADAVHNVIVYAGWPFRSLWCIGRAEQITSDDFTLTVRGGPGVARVTYGGLGVSKSRPEVLFNNPAWRLNRPTVVPLPYLPLWPGFFANTAIYSIAWWLLLSIPAALRRLRATPSVCKACRYDLRGLPAGSLCPECGKLTELPVELIDSVGITRHTAPFARPSPRDG